jgi:hypothetical protein
LNSDDLIRQINDQLSENLDGLLERVAVLERRRGLHGLGLAPNSLWYCSQSRVDAKMELARWRVSRLECFDRNH